MSQILSQNLKRLRTEKNYTQEEAARILGVTAQTISRWECNITLPDVMLLPEIAKLYCVTIDDLFMNNIDAYDNYAQRLFAIYENSRKPSDFIRADEEFKKMITTGKYSSEDLRLYGISHQYMATYCINKGLELFDQVLNTHEEKDDVYWQTRRQKLLFLSQIGRSQEGIELQRKRLETSQHDPEEWICMVAAYSYAGEAETALQWFQCAIQKFPDHAILYVYGGDLCKRLGQIPEAIEHWDHALELDPTLNAVKYSKGFYYEEMGEWKKAYETWIDIAEEDKRDGRTHEMQYPFKLAEKCLNKLERKAKESQF